MKFIEANSFAELYQKAMLQVYENYDFCTKPRNMNIREYAIEQSIFNSI